MLGRLVATSIIQEGPGLPIFLPAAYMYVSRDSEYLSKIDTVPDPTVMDLVKEVSVCGCVIGICP